MRKSVWLAVLCVSLAACQSSRPFGDNPFPSYDAPIDQHEALGHYAGWPGAYLLYDKAISHSVKPDFTVNERRWRYEERLTVQRLVLDPQSPLVNTFRLAVAPGQYLEAMQLQVRHEDGSTTDISPKSVERWTGSGDTLHYEFVYEHLAAGDVIEEVYQVAQEKLKDGPQVEHDEPLRLLLPCNELRFSYAYPDEWDIEIKETHLGPELFFTHTHDEENRIRTIEYAVSEIPGYRQTFAGQYLKEASPYLHFQIGESSIGYVWAYTAPTTWETIADEHRVYQGRRSTRVPSRFKKQLDAELVDVTNGAVIAERTQAALRKVLTIDPSFTETRARKAFRKGKASPALMTALTQYFLEERGITASYLVAHSARNDNFDSNFIAGSQVPVPALQLPDTRGADYLFPGVPYVPFGFVPNDLAGQPALTVPAKGEIAHTRIGYTTGALSEKHESYTLHLEAGDETWVEAHVTLDGATTYAIRMGETTDINVATLAFSADSRQMENLSITAENEERGAMHVLAGFNLDACVARTDDHIGIDSCGMLSALESKIDSSWAPLPWLFRQDRVLRKTVRIIPPGGWEWGAVENDVDIQNQYGRFTRRTRTEAGDLVVDQELHLVRATIDEAAYKTFANLLQTDLEGEPTWTLQKPTLPVIAGRLDFTPLEIEPGGPWTLVVAGHGGLNTAREEAVRYANTLQRMGYQVSVLLDQTDNQGVYRVVVGTFASRSGVESARKQLKGVVPFDTWMLSLTGEHTAALPISPTDTNQ